MKDRRIRPWRPGLDGRTLLERWMIRGRLTQAEAADQIGISRVKLNQYLNSSAKPSIETAIRIEDATGIGVRMWLVEAPADEVTNENHDAADVPVGVGGDVFTKLT